MPRVGSPPSAPVRPLTPPAPVATASSVGPPPAATARNPAATTPPAAHFDPTRGTAVVPAPGPTRRPPTEPLWKSPPPGAAVTANDTGRGAWVEKWRSPKTGKWVHNYTLTFIATRANKKFADNVRVAQQLPAIRQQVAGDLQKDGSKEQVLALIVTLMDQAYFRVGNETSDDHGVYGVTTLEKRHVTVHRQRARFDYVGKKKVTQHRIVTDRTVAKLLRRLKKQAPTDDARLFSHKGNKIDAGEVNDYLDAFDVTAKQFRTFHSTRLVREGLLALGDVPKAEREDAVDGVVIGVAELLGHTAAVNRKSYTDPKVIASFLKGKLR